MKKKKKSNISGDIIEIYGRMNISDDSELILCDISWNDKPARLELRIVKSNGFFGAGFPLNRETFKEIKKMIKNAEINFPSDDKVDFDEIFTKSSTISEARKKYSTKKGRISLKSK